MIIQNNQRDTIYKFNDELSGGWILSVYPGKTMKTEWKDKRIWVGL
jgi:hypothetical protein